MAPLRLIPLVLLLAGLTAGCAGTRPGTEAVADLAGPTWHLTAFGDALRPPPILGDTEITLSFDEEEGRVAGSAGCNSYFASYELEGAALTLDEAGATLMACAPPAMERERAFLDALKEVRAWRREGDRLELLNAEGGQLLVFGPEGEAGTMEPQPTARTAIFECEDAEGGDFSFTIRTGPGEIALWLPERFGSRYLVLGQTRTASGVRYEGDGVVVWNKGDEALLEVDGQAFEGCTENPMRAPWEEARRRGVTFRAIGQEPGWHLEIGENRHLRFVYDYGEREVEAPASSAEAVIGRITYHASADGQELTVTVTELPCTDTMSGEAFERTVTVEFGGQTYRGCGRDL